jgi:hypothetical protein
MWIPDRVLRGMAQLFTLAGCSFLGTIEGVSQVPAALRDDQLCPEVFESADGARNDPNALIYGLVLSDEVHAVEVEYAHRLAIDDLRTAVTDGELPSGSTGAGRRVAVFLCTQGRPENDSVTGRAVDYLITRVGVSAIVTLTTEQALAAQQAIVASGASVLLICEACAFETRELSKGMGDASLVFQSFPPRTSWTPLVYRKLPELEAYVRTLRGFDGATDIRVAVLHPDSDVLGTFAATTDGSLVINGAKASLQSGTNYLRVAYAGPRSAIPPSPTEVAARIAAFRPHIVMGIADHRVIISIMDALERQLESSAPKPLYWGWYPHGALTAFVGSDDDRRTRVYSHAPGSGPPTPGQRERRMEANANFRGEFPAAPVALSFESYLVPYQIMYAAVGAGPVTGRLSGADLARGIGNTQKAGAKEVFTGRRDLVSGLADAASGPIALNGLSNFYPLNWSHSPDGAPIADYGRVSCFTRNAAGALVDTSAGQVWDRRTNSLTGVFVPCP